MRHLALMMLFACGAGQYPDKRGPSTHMQEADCGAAVFKLPHGSVYMVEACDGDTCWPAGYVADEARGTLTVACRDGWARVTTALLQ